MSKCPCWSTIKERVNCYKDCPMYAISNDIETCPFKELSVSGNKTSFSDSLNDDLFYSQDRYLNYDEEDKVINY